MFINSSGQQKKGRNRNFGLVRMGGNPCSASGCKRAFALAFQTRRLFHRKKRKELGKERKKKLHASYT
jgi:hypothetical protein